LKSNLAFISGGTDAMIDDLSNTFDNFNLNFRSVAPFWEGVFNQGVKIDYRRCKLDGILEGLSKRLEQVAVKEEILRL
jgi:hypothetical protein